MVDTFRCLLLEDEAEAAKSLEVERERCTRPVAVFGDGTGRRVGGAVGNVLDIAQQCLKAAWGLYGQECFRGFLECLGVYVTNHVCLLV